MPSWRALRGEPLQHNIDSRCQDLTPVTGKEEKGLGSVDARIEDGSTCFTVSRDPSSKLPS